MDPQSQAELNTILAKDPETLNEEEIAILRARQSYLKKIQLDEYDAILNPKTKPPEQEPVKENAKSR